ncbi:MAG: hypothetical protein ABSG57_00710 [Candidatus Bathyarchaeia archaeon]
MVSETVISVLLEASLTGMGLVLAVYALLTPISTEIFEQRAETLEDLIKKFDEDHSKLTGDSPDDDWKKLRQKQKEINKIRVLPWSFGFGIVVAFALFSLSFILSMFWLGSDIYHTSLMEFSIFLFCSGGWLTFTFVGVSIIAEIVDSLTKKFEGIKKKQKATKKEKTKELEKLKKDIEELKRKEAKESLKSQFSLLRFQEESDKPIKSSWSIRILQNDRPIEKCSVTYGGVKLPWWDKLDEPHYEEFINTMSGGNVRIPKGIENEDSRVVVRDGKKTIREKIFKDIPIVPK